MPAGTMQSPRDDPDQLLTEIEAAQILKFTPRALQAWRCRGGGPPFVRISARAIRYRRSDLSHWIAERLRTSTSDDGA
jgi:predicted DNA-binding transcriptional regulator AlpA